MTSKQFAVYRYFDGAAIFSGSFDDCRRFIKRANGSFWLYVAKA